MYGTALQWAVDQLAPVLSTEQSIGQVMATRILSTDPRAEYLWMAIRQEQGAPTAEVLNARIPLLAGARWENVLEQLRRTYKAKVVQEDPDA